MAVDTWTIVFCLFLIGMSGLFSGLTLGLLGLDLVNLRIIASGTSKEAEYAEKVIPIRKKGNLLLCTLLIGNVLVNAQLSILLADIFDGTVGLIISTCAITLFGEIMPQSALNKQENALYVGAHISTLVNVLVFVFYPVAWPISLCLDYVLGEELGTVYTKTQLQELVNIHKSVGTLNEGAEILNQTIEFEDFHVIDAMTEWTEVVTVASNARLDFETLETLFKAGHSRIPVVDKQGGFRNTVIGLLFVKDLILLDPEDEMEVGELVSYFKHDIIHVTPAKKLSAMLRTFRAGKSHIAIVKSASGEENIGIVTLEDIIEKILGPIYDEYDTEKPDGYLGSTETNDENKDKILELFDYRRTRGMDRGMPPQEKRFVFNHLARQVKVFMPEHRVCSESEMRVLLDYGVVLKVSVDAHGDRDKKADVAEGGLYFYRKGEESHYFTLILDGKAEVFSGVENFKAEVPRYTCLGGSMLLSMQEAIKNGSEAPGYFPDFTARLSQNSRLLRISRESFVQALKGDFSEMRPKVSSMRTTERTDLLHDI